MEWLRATYLIRSTPAEIEARSAALAVEQSVEMPLDAVRQAQIRDEVVARVAGIEPAGPAAPDRFEVQLDLATSTIGGDLAQLLNMAFGNCSLQGDVELVDLDLDPALLPRQHGPRHGIEGLRRLVGAGDGRALTCTALKPQGQSPQELAELAGTFARAGIDLIKDDHGLANQSAAPFGPRVAACQRAVEAANRRSGGTSRYAPSLVGGPRQIARQARLARDEGVEVVLVAPMLAGLAGFAELFDAAPTGVPADEGLCGLAVLAHPALGGAVAIAGPLLLGKLFRLVGADAVIFTNHGGRFAVSESSCRALADNARRPWGGLRPSLPVPAGGMTPDRVAELVRFYGRDVALLIGGALLQAGPELERAARAFVAATRAASDAAGEASDDIAAGSAGAAGAAGEGVAAGALPGGAG
jgi:ribulose-bisphosphate carboxylase large chain